MSNTPNAESDPVVEHARAAEGGGLAVIATDADGSIVYWGPGAEALYGWKESEVVGRRIIDVTPSALSREEGEEIMRLLHSGRPWSGDFVVRGKDGHRFDVTVVDTPVRDESGRLLGIVGVSSRARYTSD